jgi:hypothetical protein
MRKAQQRGPWIDAGHAFGLRAIERQVETEPASTSRSYYLDECSAANAVEVVRDHSIHTSSAKRRMGDHRERVG